MESVIKQTIEKATNEFTRQISQKFVLSKENQVQFLLQDPVIIKGYQMLENQTTQIDNYLNECNSKVNTLQNFMTTLDYENSSLEL